MPQRTSVSSPALVRLLSRLSQTRVVGPGAPLAAALSQWLGWTESIVLSTALNAASDKSNLVAGQEVSENADAAESRLEIANAEATQLKHQLQEAIRAALAPPAPATSMQRRQMRGAPKAAPDLDFPSYRRRYSLVQQKMESGITELRARLRARLAAQSPLAARLAAIDAAMEQALTGQELRLLASIPNLLERHFLSLSQAGQPQPAARPGQFEQAPGAEAQAPGAEKQAHDADGVVQQAVKQPALRTAASRAVGAAAQLKSGPWLDTFREDMRAVLLAELDLRLEPIEGLLCALRDSIST
ncbi:MAG TPA: DUF3348 family protein [Pusillimonas sp.]|nr:DUF3348 family protein [Pusillimonas sp.]